MIYFNRPEGFIYSLDMYRQYYKKLRATGRTPLVLREFVAKLTKALGEPDHAGGQPGYLLVDYHAVIDAVLAKLK